MSTIVKPPNSKKYHADFCGLGGKKKRLSTRVEDKTAAKVVSGHCELFARRAAKNKVSHLEVWESAAILSKAIDEEVCGPCLVSEYLPRIAEELSCSPADARLKTIVARRMSEYCVEMDQPQKRMWDVDVGDARGFLNWCKKQFTLSERSVRTYGQAMHVLWEAALDDKKVRENVWDKVKLPKRPKTSPRRPFTEAELRTLYFGADEEWRGIVVVGICTALRISDVSLLLCRDIDLATGMIQTKALKSDETEVKPIPPSVLDRFRRYCANKKPDDPLFPRAYRWRINADSASRVSNEFVRLLKKLGLRVGGEKVRGVQRIGANKYLPLSFHCLRHNYVTLVQLLGASQAVAGELAGQKSAAVVSIYTHFSHEHLRNAVKHFPDPFAGLDEKAAEDSNQLKLGL